MEPAIELHRVHKRYGARRGIEDVSLEVPVGELFGFIGPNGAGKTTTIRILLGLLHPTSGAARLFGVSCADPAARASVGYVPGEVDLMPGLRVGELLAYLGGFHPGEHATRRAELVERFLLDVDARTEDLSLGTKRKVALVAALQHAPRLLVLDEPTSGLDPVIRARLFDLLRDEVARGTTVFISSHVLADIETLCRRVAVIREGRLRAIDDIGQLRAQQVRRVSVSFDGGGDGNALERLAIRLEGTSGLERHGSVMTFAYRGPMPPLLDALAAAAPADVRIETPTLEDVFVAELAGEVPHAL